MEMNLSCHFFIFLDIFLHKSYQYGRVVGDLEAGIPWTPIQPGLHQCSQVQPCTSFPPVYNAPKLLCYIPIKAECCIQFLIYGGLYFNVNCTCALFTAVAGKTL